MRENLSSLDTHIATLNSDSEKFNEYTKINYKAVTAIGQRCDNMMSKPVQGISGGRRQIVCEVHPTPKVKLQ